MVAERPVAVVTGAASGIGRATAERLAADGFTVAAADLDEAGVQATVAGRAGTHAFPVDVADQDRVIALAGAVQERLGVPWAVVNCAGWDVIEPFLDTEPAFWRRVLDINLLGVVQVCHAFLAPMLAAGGGGRFVNVASDAGRVGSSGEAVYSGAKGGVIAFTKSLAREVARAGITANVVCPGPTDTPLLRRQSEGIQAALERAIPMRRLAQPVEIAHAIAFFASEPAGYVTGQVLSVNGGLVMSG